MDLVTYELDRSANYCEYRCQQKSKGFVSTSTGYKKQGVSHNQYQNASMIPSGTVSPVDRLKELKFVSLSTAIRAKQSNQLLHFGFVDPTISFSGYEAKSVRRSKTFWEKCMHRSHVRALQKAKKKISHNEKARSLGM
jgi:hypothetical protein